MTISKSAKPFPQDTVLKTERLLLRPTRREDLDLEDLWPDYEDPIHQHYNPWHDSVASKNDRWKYNDRLFDLKLAIEWNNELVGYIALFNSDLARGTAEMGIQFAENRRGMGFCKESLKKLCEKYFDEWGMHEMHLEVAIFNLIAIRCYEQCGFKRIKEFWNPHAYQRFLDFEHDLRLTPLRPHFRRVETRIEVKYLEMQLTRTEYYNFREKL
jgi:diamine N-acetyltransferase